MGLDYGESTFRVHETRSPNRGSRLANILLVVVLLLIGGVAYYIFKETPRLVQHIAAEDALALPAVHALTLKGTPLPEGAVPVLKKVLDKGESASLRAACAGALAMTQSKDVVAELGDAATRDPSADVRAAATKALGDNGGGLGTGRYITAALNDEADDVKAAAAVAAGQLEIRSLIPRLIELLGAPDRSLREAALKGLESFLEEGRSFGMDPMKWKEWHGG